MPSHCGHDKRLVPITPDRTQVRTASGWYQRQATPSRGSLRTDPKLELPSGTGTKPTSVSKTRKTHEPRATFLLPTHFQLAALAQLRGPGGLSPSPGTWRALERAAKRRPQHPPSPKQLSPKPGVRPAPPAQPSPAPRSAPDWRRGRWLGRESAPGRTKPPARTPHAAGGQKEPSGLRKATRPLPALCGQSGGPAPGEPSAPAHSGTSPTLVAGPRARSAVRLPTTLARRCPAAPSGCPSLRRRPTMGSPRRRRRCGQRPGPGGTRQRDPRAHLPPAARGAAPLARGLLFPSLPVRGHRRAFAFGKHGLQRRGRRARRRRRYRPVSRAALLPAPSRRSPARSHSSRRAPSLPGAGSALFPAVKASAPAAAPSPWNSSRAGSA